MSVSPILPRPLRLSNSLSRTLPNPLTLPRPLHQAWIPVFFGLTVICCESTPMLGGRNTGRWLGDIWPGILGQANTPFFGLVHHLLRKTGHFTGYGTLGLLLREAWHRSVRAYMNLAGNQLMLAACALAVSFTFLVGCLDEWHQSVIPGRVSTGTDVLIDTSGALVFNLVLWAVVAVRRGRA